MNGQINYVFFKENIRYKLLGHHLFCEKLEMENEKNLEIRFF